MASLCLNPTFSPTTITHKTTINPTHLPRSPFLAKPSSPPQFQRNSIKCSLSNSRPEYIPNRIPDPNYVRIFDTTLRDGEQSPGATMTSSQKLDIARQLSKLGVDIIEAGFPAASKDDLEAVKMIAKEVGNNVNDDGHVPVICGLARCNRNDIDASWEAVKFAKRPRIHTFIATSEIHLKYKLMKSRDDKCTRLFHKVMNSSCMSSNFNSLIINGLQVEDKAEIKKHIVTYFNDLYTETEYSRPFFEDLHLNKLEEQSKLQLELPFSEDEILQAIASLAGDKTPGPDGFPMLFYLKTWDIIKTEVLRVAEDYHKNGFLDWRLNTTFISLIPKKEGERELRDFRPICLLSGIYKIFGKLLARRLSGVLEGLISEYQFGGFPGSNIHEGILIANELVDSQLKAKLAGLVFKIDFQKAFDTVSWGFLDALLEKMGFGVLWRKWLNSSWKSSRFSILVEGSPVGFFKSSRGIRQGDPLSPLLFSLVAEALTQMILKAEEKDLIQGMSIKEGGETIPVIQYADDTMVLVRDSESVAKNLKALFLWFDAMTGLHVNSAKSKIYQINEVMNWEDIRLAWGCSEGVLPDLYLGLPFASKYKQKEVWQPLLDKFRGCLSQWKRRYLTKAGRLVLIKSTLASIPVYMLSLFVIPVSIAEELERIIRNFLWGSTEVKQKFHLLSWDQITIPLKWGGLGIRRIREINISLLCKWLWQLGLVENKLWKRLIFAKYGREEGNWMTKAYKGNHGCGLWKGILQHRDFFESKIHYLVGKGDRVKFWEDKWCLNEPLKEKYPLLYEVSRKKGALVSNVFLAGEQCTWSLEPCRRLTDAEIREFTQLSDILSNFRLTEDEDERQWEDGDNNFSARTVSNTIMETRRLSNALGTNTFPWKRVWNSKCVPPKVSFFVWTLLRGRILTLDNLRARGLQITNRCPFCKHDEESIEHMFERCRIIKKIWDYFWVDAECGVVSDNRLKDRIEHKGRIELSRVGKLYWNYIFHAIVWGLWLERNSRQFDGKELPVWKIICEIKELIWSWGLTEKEGRAIRIDTVMCDWENLIRL